MTYSCAIFPDLDSDLKNGEGLKSARKGAYIKSISGVAGGVGDGNEYEIEDDLEAAQLAKLRLVSMIYCQLWLMRL